MDTLFIKVKDMTGRVIYKSAIDINSTEKIAEVFLILEKFGVDIDKVYHSIKKRQEEINYYDRHDIWDIGFNPDDSPFAK